MSDVLAARSQMAVSLAFHIIFAIIGIAMPVLMVIAERRWQRTRDPVYLDLAKRWARGTACSRWVPSRERCCRSSWGCCGRTSWSSPAR